MLWLARNASTKFGACFRATRYLLVMFGDNFRTLPYFEQFLDRNLSNFRTSNGLLTNFLLKQAPLTGIQPRVIHGANLDQQSCFRSGISGPVRPEMAATTAANGGTIGLAAPDLHIRAERPTAAVNSCRVVTEMWTGLCLHLLTAVVV